MNDKQFHTWEEAVSWLTAQPDRQELVRACYYDLPLQTAADRYWKSEEWKTIQTFIPQKLGTVLDIGAGNGIASYAFAKDGWKVSSLEPDPSSLVGVGAIKQLAQTNNLAIEVVQEFGEKLPFQNDSFDVVFARQVLHHAQDLPQLCREINRVLKPGGKLIGIRDHVISSKKDLSIFLDIHPLHKLYGGENAFLLSEYINSIKSSGLHLQKVIGPFDSVINYAPRSKEELKEELKQRLNKIPAGKVILGLLSSRFLLNTLLSTLSRIDQRPGRLFSFIATKLE